MTKRMLIDATHAEETRVVVLDGNRLEDYDVETATKRQLKGNIYLAKVVRVEPSLQAAFVEYGGNRHGFLAFAEIHPDYYQIPVADRQKLLAMQEAEARAVEEADDAEAEAEARATPVPAAALSAAAELTGPADPDWPGAEPPFGSTAEPDSQPDAPPGDGDGNGDQTSLEAEPFVEAPPPETVGGDAETADDLRPGRIPSQFLRQYKIQEVVHRRQILLVQVVKEERGAKGAALTSYISLAGRYCVLMPNSPRGGGISRKITSLADRRRLKEITAELSIPAGMGLIVRTAGANRPKPEIRRDCEYLLRLWDEIRDTVMKSVAPASIYEEASLIKRAIRDVYSRDIEEVLVDGEAGWQAARDFMRMLMPTHVRKVQLWKDPAGRSLFSHERVEAELDAVLSPIVALRSGGSLVINQTEALVAIDVNSGRSTRERNIEETALRTNLEAAEEAARQLRLRDLAGLIVIDFIDMEARKHNAMVERRLKEALKNDRARVQVGHISHFGLLEMSRQRLRPSLAETSFLPCPHCAGSGHVRSVESAAIHLLRLLEDEASRRRSGELRVHAAADVALYILNHKRAWLAEIETRHAVTLDFIADDDQPASAIRIDHAPGTAAAEPAAPAAPASQPAGTGEPEVEVPETEPVAVAADAEPATADAEPGEETEEGDRRRRRRRRRRRHRDDLAPGASAAPIPLAGDAVPPERAEQPSIAEPPDGEIVTRPARPARSRGLPARGQPPTGGPHEGRRRDGRRDGRRRPAERTPGETTPNQPALAFPIGPTPADPFADPTLDIFDAVENAARNAAPEPPPQLLPLAPIGPVGQTPVGQTPVGQTPVGEPAGAQAVAPEAPPVDDRPAEPAVKPIVLGTEEAAPIEKKRGWWQH